MIAVFETVLLFVALLAVHVLWFRARRPRAEIRALVRLFSAGFVALVGVLAAMVPWGAPGAAAGRPEQPLTLTSIVLYLVLAVCYVAVYQGYAVVAPSAKIALLAASKPDGVLSYAELRGVLTDKELILPRLSDLVSAGLVSFDGTRYRLERRGAVLARFVSVYRGLLRKGMGG